MLTTPPPDLGKQHRGTRTSGTDCQREPAVAPPSGQPARALQGAAGGQPRAALLPAVLRQHLEARKPDQVQVLSGIAWLCIWRMCCMVTGHDCAGAGRQYHNHICRHEKARQGHKQHCTAMMGTGSPVHQSGTSNIYEWRIYLQAVGDPNTVGLACRLASGHQQPAGQHTAPASEPVRGCATGARCMCPFILLSMPSTLAHSE